MLASVVSPEDEPTLTGDLEVIRSLRAGAPCPVLEQLRGVGAPRRVPIDQDELVVGRSHTADVQIDSHVLSRRHLGLRRRGYEIVCTDLDSHAGVWLNGIRVHSAVLRDGDQLQIGDVVFVYREVRGA